jgi:hypothetical protein
LKELGLMCFRDCIHLEEWIETEIGWPHPVQFCSRPKSRTYCCHFLQFSRNFSPTDEHELMLRTKCSYDGSFLRKIKLDTGTL